MRGVSARSRAGPDARGRKARANAGRPERTLPVQGQIAMRNKTPRRGKGESLAWRDRQINANSNIGHY